MTTNRSTSSGASKIMRDRRDDKLRWTAKTSPITGRKAPSLDYRRRHPVLATNCAKFFKEVVSLLPLVLSGAT